MILNIWDDMCWLYTNTMVFYIRDLSMDGFQYPNGEEGTGNNSGMIQLIVLLSS